VREITRASSVGFHRDRQKDEDFVYKLFLIEQNFDVQTRCIIIKLK